MEFIPIGVYGRYAGVEGACSCYLLKTGNADVVLDMGSGSFRELRKEIDIRNIDAVIATHLHFDHICDMLVMQYYLEYNKHYVDLYLPQRPERISDLFSSQYCNKKIIGNEIEINGLTVEPMKISHSIKSDTDSYAFKIKGDKSILVYTGDFCDVKEYSEIVKDADIIFADCCITDSEYVKGSPHAGAGSIAKATPAGAELYLTHLTEGSEKRLLDEAKAYCKNAAIAEPHTVIEF